MTPNPSCILFASLRDGDMEHGIVGDKVSARLLSGAELHFDAVF